MTTLRIWHGDGYDSVSVFGLGGIDAMLQRIATANTNHRHAAAAHII